MRLALALIFLLSGAAGLWYEAAWSRYLGLFVGHAAYAQVIVLAIFLGGMALGAWLVGRVTERLARPLLGYALVETAVGIAGLFFHEIYLAVTGWAYASAFPATGGPVSLMLVRWGIAALLILPQSVLLGATFPLMTAGALRAIRPDPGRTIATLYFANSFGAAAGVLIAGFYLVAAVGLPGVVVAASVINFVVAIGAVLAGAAGAAEKAEGSVRIPVSSASPALPAARLLLGLSFATAVASFSYEIAWTRMLSLVLSSATHAFELMLSAFILGLALGSFWCRSRVDRFRDPLRTLGIVQWLMGFLALATLPFYFRSFGWTSTLLLAVARSDPGYQAFNLARYAICLLVILPATFCAGITLPLITRTLVLGGVGEKAIGQVYAANAVGSIVGVSLAALVLLPLIGLKGVLVSGALLDMAVGVVLLLLLARSSADARPLARAALAGLVVVAGGAALGPAFSRPLLLSGVYRYGAVPAPGSRDILYYRDGRTATISAERIKATGEIFIATNGKSDGALPAYWFEPCADTAPRLPLRGDVATFSLSPLIALAHRPEARTVAVIGQGTGMSAHLLLGSPGIKGLYTIEIEPEMIRASRAFYPVNRRVFDDPRSHYIVDDAKSYFAAAGRRYDLIFSEPSQPWVSGVSGLFSQEFYGRVTRYLEPNGVFAQWIHLYDIDDQLVLTVLAALHRTFRDYEVFMPTVTDMLVVATNGGTLSQPDWRVFQLPDVAKDLCHQIPFTPEALEATRLGNRTSLGPLVELRSRPNSDFLPLLDLGAERARFMGLEATGIYGLSAERFDITAPLTGRRVGPASFTHAPAPDVPRMHSLALGATLRDPRSYLSADSNPGDEVRAAALFRDRAWRALLASPDPPTSWRIWLQHMAAVDVDRYGGTSGYADPAFYQELSRYLDRHRAPPEARAAVEFRHALSAWDFRAAIRAADPLIAATRGRRGWIPADELLAGVTVAHLMTGDVPGAREVFARLVPFSRMGSTDFRLALLASYLDRWREP